MKLRNKKTGEIVEPFGITCMNGRTFIQFDDGKGTFKFEARSLAELNEEWEDYDKKELPKSYWVIEPYGKVEHIKLDKHWSEDLYYQFKDFGNYFETREEAEKAVEKLKAWRRLKDKGFKFFNNKIIGEYGNVSYKLTYPATAVEEKELNLLFGGEE